MILPSKFCYIYVSKVSSFINEIFSFSDTIVSKEYMYIIIQLN